MKARYYVVLAVVGAVLVVAVESRNPPKPASAPAAPLTVADLVRDHAVEKLRLQCIRDEMFPLRLHAGCRDWANGTYDAQLARVQAKKP